MPRASAFSLWGSAHAVGPRECPAGHAAPASTQGGALPGACDSRKRRPRSGPARGPGRSLLRGRPAHTTPARIEGGGSASPDGGARMDGACAVRRALGGAFSADGLRALRLRGLRAVAQALGRDRPPLCASGVDPGHGGAEQCTVLIPLSQENKRNLIERLLTTLN